MYTITVIMVDTRGPEDPVEVENSKTFGEALEVFTILSSKYIKDNTNYAIHMSLFEE